MIIQKHKDILAFSYGEGDISTASAEQKDPGIYKYRQNYINGDDALTSALKNAFYAVMLHGWVNTVTPAAANNSKAAIRWDAPMLANHIFAHSVDSGARAILMLSCFTGYGFARPIAVKLKRPVVAPRSTALVGPNCRIYVKAESDDVINPPGQSYYVATRLDWVCCYPNGDIKIICGAELDKGKAIEAVKNVT
jgi:hypothetical protein